MGRGTGCGEGFSPSPACRALGSNYQPVLFYVRLDGIAEPTLLNQGLRNTDSP
jgi:hypothetical protein